MTIIVLCLQTGFSDAEMHRWVNRLMHQTHRKLSGGCHLLLVAISAVNTMVNHTGGWCRNDWAVARGNIWDLGVSPVSSFWALEWPSRCSTSQQGHHVCAKMDFPQYTGPGEPNQCFLSITRYKYIGWGIPGLHSTALLMAWEHTRSHSSSMLSLPIATTPVTYMFPGISVAMGMFSFKLWRMSMLNRHPGGLTASICSVFPTRKEPRGDHELAIAIDEVEGMNWVWFQSLQLGSKSERTWLLSPAAVSCQLPQNYLFVSPQSFMA